MSKTLADLNTCSRDDFIAALGNIFEHSPWIAEQAAMKRPFAGINQLFAAMKAAVDRAPPELRLALIKAHPDLADKTQRAAGLTAESTRSRTASASTACRMPNTRRSSASTTPIARNSAFPLSSAFAAIPGIPSCAISSGGCRTMP